MVEVLISEDTQRGSRICVCVCVCVCEKKISFPVYT